MKNLNKLFVLAIITVLAYSCVGDDDFNPPTPGETIDIPEPANVVSLSDVVSAYYNSGDETMDFQDDPNYVVGYVVSSDEAGNFYKEMVVQDAAQDPTAGVLVNIDLNPLFTRYNFGRKVYIKLDGLTIGENNGVINLGVGDEMDRIQGNRADEFIIRDDEVATIVPKEITFNDFNDNNELQFVTFAEVQFTDAEIGNSFASEPQDGQYDGTRFIQTCSDFFAPQARIETSTFADFKSVTVPNGSGDLSGILTRNFGDDYHVIYINTTEDINFDTATRCEFDVVSCGTVGAAGANTLLSENFETQSTGAAAMPAGWTNYQEAGTETWEVYTAGGTNSSQGKSVSIGSYQSGDASTVAWLITPQFDFDAQTGEVFSFETSNSFADGSTMEVMFSDDWDGTTAGITTATWKPLADATIVADGDFYGDWIFSGNASLDCLTGTGNIAFRYQGSGDSVTDGTYELDNISLTSD